LPREVFSRAESEVAVSKSIVFTLALACSAPAFAQVSTPPSTPTSTPTYRTTTPPNSTPASSQSSPHYHREWEGSFFAGYAFLRDYKFQTVVLGSEQESPGVVGMQFDSGYRLGARVTQNLRDYFAATVEYGFADQPLRFTNLTPRAPTVFLDHYIHSLTYEISYTPMTRDKRFRPYISGGAGALLFHLTEDAKAQASARGIGLEDSWELVFSWGVGFKHLVADRFAVVVDFKGRVSDTPTYGLPRFSRLVDGQYLPAISTRGLMHSWQLNLGLAHQWDSW
jgi:hypothetical protein